MDPATIGIVSCVTNGDIRKAVEQITEQVTAALLRVEESHAAHEDNPTAGKRVYVSPSIHFLNWHVWSLRYHVPLEFIIDFLLFEKFRLQRQVKPFTISLGLGIEAITGPAACQAVENHVMLTYPNGENILAYRQSILCRMMPPEPTPQIDYSGPDDMCRIYTKTMEQRRATRSAMAQKVRFERQWREKPL
jgi:hypothetical protein